MITLQFSETDFLAAAKLEEDFTNTKDKSFETGAEAFLKEFYRDALQNEFLNYSLDDLVQLARTFWMFGNRRKTGDILLTVTPSPTPANSRRPDTAIMAVTDDMAFLVDSMVTAVSSFGIDVNGLFHPVVEGYRDKNCKWLESKNGDGTIKESMILVMVPPQSARMRTALEKELRHTLEDVKTINEEFKPLVKTVRFTAAELEQQHGDVPKEEVIEAVEFLDWIADGNFVLFGSRRYNFLESAKNGSSSPDYVNPSEVKDYTHGLLNDSELKVLRQASEPSVITSNVQAFLKESPPVTVAKSNLSSRVHRRVRMDYISVKTYGDNGDITGETRFIGLFTSDAYSRAPAYVPLSP